MTTLPRESVESIARSWIKTPFAPNASAKGYGCSCQGLAASIYIEAGVLPEGYEFPHAPMDWAHANSTPLLEPAIDNGLRDIFDGFTLEGASVGSPDGGPERRPDAPFSISDIRVGDLLGFKIGACVHHLGISTGNGQFVHVWKDQGVMEAQVEDACFISRLKRVWRPHVWR